MKVLLLYQFGREDQHISMLFSHLNKNFIEADSLNIVNFEFLSKSKTKLPGIYRFLLPLLKIPKIRGVISDLFRKNIILSLAKKYQVVDIHFFSTFYDKIIPQMKALSMRIKVTVWGNDFYGLSAERTEQQRPLYGLVDCIQIATQKMSSDFLEKFPEYSSKIRFAHFGIQQFKLLKDLDNIEGLNNYRHEFEISSEQIIIACGYNGSKSQQHSIIIDSISKLPSYLKSGIFLLLQMTYGSTPKYIKDTKNQLERAGLSYKLITEYLTLEKVAKLRLLTDITINIQKTDAFSASIQESIFAGNVIIAGDWLPYNHFEDNGIYLVKTNIEGLTSKIKTCLDQFTSFKARCSYNREKINCFSSWGNSLKDWVSIYRELEGDLSLSEENHKNENNS